MTASVRKATLTISAIIFLAGVLSAVMGLASVREKMGAISRQQVLLARLTDLEGRLNAIADARKAIDGLEDRTPADMDELIRKAGFAEKVTDSRDALSNAGHGWSVLTREISLSDVVLSDLEQFFALCQDGRPPWTVTTIVVRASPFESGRGQAVFTIQALRGKSQ